MQFLHTFGITDNRILKKACYTQGTVTDVNRCWWIKIKTKPARLYASDKNTIYPHFITFRYFVDGNAYTGKRYIPIGYRVPRKAEKICIYYAPHKPKQYACYAFGPGLGTGLS